MTKRVLALLGFMTAALAYGATTYTTNYNLAKPGDGDTNYGELLRDNFDTIDTQLKTNETSSSDHLNDTVDAHDSTAISTPGGTYLCPSSTTVEAYLDCLDGTFNPSTSSVVLLTGAQTITGLKTFSTTPVFSAATNGILNTDGSGVISASTFSALAPLTTKGDVLTFSTAETRLGVGSDGQVLSADSTAATGLAWVNMNPRWRKFTYTNASFSTAATSNTITAFTLAAQEGLKSVIVKHTTAFSGGAITAYTVEVGQTGSLDEWAPAFDIFQAVSNTLSQPTQVLDVPNFAATVDVKVTARSTGANLDAATAGSVDIYFETFTLP